MELNKVVKSGIKIAGLAGLAGLGFAGYKVATKSKELKEEFGEVTMFKGRTVSYAGEVFVGDSVASMFSGMVIDLRDSTIEEPAVLQIYAEFSGVKVIVPDDWTVKVGGNAEKSGVSSTIEWEGDVEEVPQLTIEYDVKFSGLEIKRAAEVEAEEEEDFYEDYEEFVDDLEDASEDVAEKVEDVAEEAQKKAEELAKAAKDKAAEVKDAVEEAVKDL
ncbi:hypothetical protein [Anaerotalea alkaliphila]|uniref:Uncharacterized protein n=1 Tax=Anaerotalea alkaliphila TaxID=2662126 RepID=A0A7X5KMH5_9FIRM|nr:hypothetical protein [Anaerotalea alkaliphila]NDL67996.1 hypothetical protein [Anaerotalea alkaliphila]